MRHPIEGTPYVPPHCPVRPKGDIPNLETAHFELSIDPGLGRPTDIYASFVVHSEERPIVASVETDPLSLPPEDPLVQKVQRLINTAPDGGKSGSIAGIYNLWVEYMRITFCDRVFNCQRPEDGKCWALGAKAVKKVVEETLGGYDPPPPAAQV